MKPLFRIDVAFDEDKQEYFVLLFSLTDNLGVPMKGKPLRKLLARATKLIREKNSEVKHFPLPEPSRIIAPNGNGAPNLLVVPR